MYIRTLRMHCNSAVVTLDDKNDPRLQYCCVRYAALNIVELFLLLIHSTRIYPVQPALARTHS